MGERLSDLDELLVRARYSESRRQLAEAIACYHVGAYRAAIVSAWRNCVCALAVNTVTHNIDATFAM